MVKKKKIDTGLERAELFLKEKPAYLKKSYYNFYIYYNKKYPTLKPPSEDQFKEARKELRKKIYPNKSKVWTGTGVKTHLPNVLQEKNIDLKKELKVLRGYFKGEKEAKIINWPPPKYTKNRNTPGTYYVTGCAHAPWHNKAMYNSVFTYLSKEVELQGLILAGDIADLNSLSAHDRGKIALPEVTLEWEYKESGKFLDEFDDLNIKRTKDFIYGNHEDRYNRITKDVDIAKYGSALKSPIEGLKLLERGYNVFTNWKNDCISLGPHLDINHGEFLNVHSAKKTIDTYRKSIMYFHTHRFQIYIEGLVGGFNMGSGANFNAPVFNYATRAMKNSWINSSALVTLDNDGFYHVQPLMWINNQLVINGVKY